MRAITRRTFFRFGGFFGSKALSPNRMFVKMLSLVGILDPPPARSSIMFFAYVMQILRLHERTIAVAVELRRRDE